MIPLNNWIMDDGSRCFLTLTVDYPPEPFCDHLAKLPGVVIDQFVPDDLAGAIIELSYSGFTFSIITPPDEFCFYVNQADCPEDILQKLAGHAVAFSKSAD